MLSHSGKPDLRRRVRLPAGLFLLIFTAAAQCASPPEFPDVASLEQFVLASSDTDIKTALATALTMDGAGGMIGLAVKMGPAYATKVASLLPDRDFSEGYRDLARYLDLYGPCHKKQTAAEGWWSNYPDPPSEQYCGEATKLLFSALLWNQVHYCGRLVTGEDKPKVAVPAGRQPPYRLDEPPVATHWLHAGVLYAVTDAALQFDLAKTLRARAAAAPGRVRSALLAAASELERQPPSREMAALAIAKLLLRRYEQTHLEHLARLNPQQPAQPH